MSKRAKKSSKNFVIKIIIILMAILVIMGVSILIWYGKGISPLRSNDEAVEVLIPLGTGTSGIAKILKENNIIRSELAFKIYTRLGNTSDFQAGVYHLKPSMGLRDITDMLQTGKVYDPNQFNVTFVEGKNMIWLARLIENNTNNTFEDVYDLLEDEEYINSLIEKYWFLDEVILDEEIYYPLEGYLFPDTYTLPNKSVTVKEIFELMLVHMEKVLEEYREDIESREYSVHEILTVASVVETEGLGVSGRKGVAGVIYNRLSSNMALQMDATTYYAFRIEMGTRDLTRREMDTYNPYNTSGPRMEGRLPIGPISSVSRGSIEAAIYPEESDYLFFVSDKFGMLYFRKTYSEHNRIIQELREQGIWLEY